MKNMIPKDTRSPTFTAALLTAAETDMRKRPPTD